MLGFGPHLVFDGYRCPAARLGDLGRLYRLLEELPARIGMTKIMPPYVLRHGDAAAAGHGLSGFVLIAESHVSVHTFLARRFVSIDIFSCENFDVEDAVAELRRAFAPRRVNWKLIDRGLEFPKAIGATRLLVAAGRHEVARRIGLEVPG